MKPSDVYAMPSEYSQPIWHVNDAVLEACFGMEERDLDLRGAEAANDQRIQCHLKMQYVFGEDHSSMVRALTLEGKPFGILVEAGYDGEHTQFILTDATLHAQALSIAEGWRRKPRFGPPVDANDDLQDLTFFPDTAAIRTENGFQLVDIKFVDNAGTLIFDPERFLAAWREFDGELRGLRKEEQPKGKEWVVERKAEIISKAVPEHLRSVVVNHIKERPKFIDTWFAVAVATDEGTYGIGLHAHNLTRGGGFASGAQIVTERLGGPELFEEYEARYGNRASLPTP